MKNPFFLIIVCALLPVFICQADSEDAGLQSEKAAVQSEPIEQQSGPPLIFQTAPGGALPAPQPESVDPSIIRATMKARAEYDALNREVMARKEMLFEEDPEIKKLQANMRQLQKQIDEILEADEELSRLKAELESVAPQMPFGIDKKEPRPLKTAPPADEPAE